MSLPPVSTNTGNNHDFFSQVDNANLLGTLHQKLAERLKERGQNDPYNPQDVNQSNSSGPQFRPNLDGPDHQPNNQQIQQATNTVGNLAENNKESSSFANMWEMVGLIFKLALTQMDNATKARDAATKAQVGSIKDEATDLANAAKKTMTAGIIEHSAEIGMAGFEAAGAGFGASAGIEAEEPNLELNTPENESLDLELNEPEVPETPSNEPIELQTPSRDEPILEELDEPQVNQQQQQGNEPQNNRVANEEQGPESNPEEEANEPQAKKSRAKQILRNMFLGPKGGGATPETQMTIAQTWGAMGKMMGHGVDIVGEQQKYQAGMDQAQQKTDEAAATQYGAQRDDAVTDRSKMDSVIQQLFSILNAGAQAEDQGFQKRIQF
ncbi:MAG: hypothetical protein V2J55_15295 [Candidatus Competibacteraceae bacterium]|jgi:hypothetical protein|nr:hypothetical protein [Candidatus Competibacteraceae bacterium]